jgi:hypothetical protein
MSYNQRGGLVLAERNRFSGAQPNNQHFQRGAGNGLSGGQKKPAVAAVNGMADLANLCNPIITKNASN